MSYLVNWIKENMVRTVPCKCWYLCILRILYFRRFPLKLYLHRYLAVYPPKNLYRTRNIRVNLAERYFNISVARDRIHLKTQTLMRTTESVLWKKNSFNERYLIANTDDDWNIDGKQRLALAVKLYISITITHISRYITTSSGSN